MTIGDLARRTGIRPSAIRYYESIGLLPRPARAGGRRVYDPAAVTQVQVVTAARALGFGVREIRTLVRDGEPAVTDRWRVLAKRKLPEIESLIGRAQRMKKLLETGLTCACVRIEDCLLHDCSPPIPLSRLRSPTARSGERVPAVP